MYSASMIFWAVCAIPLIVILGYLLKKDKAKGKWGLLLLVAFVLFAVVSIIYLTKDFKPLP